MDICCLTHAPFEMPGHLAVWANENHHNFTIIHCYTDQPMPSTQDFDCLCIMGGPQSPRKIQQYPYLKKEINLIKQTIKTKKPILGFCLGAQLIAEAFGAPTLKSPEREIGIYPVTLTRDGLSDPNLSEFPKVFPAMHWHSDMPGIPQGATILASSAGCPQQIIRFSPQIYGFQCHLEFTRQCVMKLVNNCDLPSGKFIQDKTTLSRNNYTQTNELLEYFLKNFFSQPTLPDLS